MNTLRTQLGLLIAGSAAFLDLSGVERGTTLLLSDFGPVYCGFTVAAPLACNTHVHTRAHTLSVVWVGLPSLGTVPASLSAVRPNSYLSKVLLIAAATGLQTPPPPPPPQEAPWAMQPTCLAEVRSGLIGPWRKASTTYQRYLQPHAARPAKLGCLAVHARTRTRRLSHASSEGTWPAKEKRAL